MRKTTEPLKTTHIGDADVGKIKGSRLVIAKGPEFLDKYMTQFIMPRRFDTAQLVLSALMQDKATRYTKQSLIATAYEIADELLLQERPTLDAALDRYWNRYMERNEATDAVMSRLVEESRDYHA